MLPNKEEEAKKNITGFIEGFKVSGNNIGIKGIGHLFEDQLLDMPKPKNFKPEDLCKKLLEEFKEEGGGSTLTVTSLSDEGKLEIATLGDSPVYLVVTNGKGKDVVIQLTEDMDAKSTRYKNLATKLGGTVATAGYYNGYLNLRLATFGAIGDKKVGDGLIQKPEKYNFGSGVHSQKLNEFLKSELDIKNADINEMLKKDAAKVVTFSDGLAQSKIQHNGKPASVAHYKIKLNDLVEDYAANTNTLPESNTIEFEKVLEKQTIQQQRLVREGETECYRSFNEEIDVAILEGDANPIILISQNSQDKLEEADIINNLGSSDDIVGGLLKPGRVKVILDGHENPKKKTDNPVSHKAAKSAEEYINTKLTSEKLSSATHESASAAASVAATTSPQVTGSKKVFVFGENHCHPLDRSTKDCAYTALNQLTDEELKEFVEKHNIKYAFFEFVFADSFKLKYQQQYNDSSIAALVLEESEHKTSDQSVYVGKNGREKEKIKAILKLQDPKYKDIKNFGELTKEEGIVKAIPLIHNLVKNTLMIEKGNTNEKIGRFGNIAERQTLAAQTQLAEKLCKLGVQVKGIETEKSFYQITDNGAADGRLESLNIDGAEVIANTQKEGNGICIIGNGHLLSFEQNKKMILGIQNELNKEGFKTETIALSSVDLNQKDYPKNNAKEIARYRNAEDFLKAIKNIKATETRQINKTEGEPITTPTVVKYKSAGTHTFLYNPPPATGSVAYFPYIPEGQRKDYDTVYYNLKGEGWMSDGDPYQVSSLIKELPKPLPEPDEYIKRAIRESLQKASNQSGFPLSEVEKLIQFAQKYGGVGHAKDPKNPSLNPMQIFANYFSITKSPHSDVERFFKQAKNFSTIYQAEMGNRNILTGRVEIRKDKTRSEIGARLTRIPPTMIKEMVTTPIASSASDLNSSKFTSLPPILERSSVHSRMDFDNLHKHDTKPQLEAKTLLATHTPSQMQQEVAAFVSQVRAKGIKVVSFDFDQTLTAFHLFFIRNQNRNPLFKPEIKNAFTNLANTSLKPTEADIKNANKIFGDKDSQDQIEFIKETFKQLQDKGIKAAITSRGEEEDIKAALTYAGIDYSKMKIEIYGREKTVPDNKGNVAKSWVLKNEYPIGMKILHIDDDKSEIVPDKKSTASTYSSNDFYGIHAKYEDGKPAFSPSSINELTNKVKSLPTMVIEKSK